MKYIFIFVILFKLSFALSIYPKDFNFKKEINGSFKEYILVNETFDKAFYLIEANISDKDNIKIDFSPKSFILRKNEQKKLKIIIKSKNFLTQTSSANQIKIKIFPIIDNNSKNIQLNLNIPLNLI